MKKIKFYILILVAILSMANLAFAQATLSIQGIIQKSNGAAVDDGKYDLTFKLYSTPSGGTAVHTETQNTAVAGGIYSAELGSGSTPLTAAFDQTYYLGVSVDGGTELIPRARLTSSPYSLALLGTSNLFPSSGAIGAGTVTPASGFQIHAKNPSGTGKMLVSGTEGASMTFDREGVANAQMGIKSDNNDLFINSSSNTAVQYQGATKLLVTNDGIRVPAIYSSATGGSLNFYVDNSPRFAVYSAGIQVNGNVGVQDRMHVNADIDGYNRLKVGGPSYLGGFVEISGSRDISWGGGTIHAPGGNILSSSPGGQTIGFALVVNGRIRANEIWAGSDKRIKKDFRYSENRSDLATLRRLQVTDYRHIDEMSQGTAFKKGFIAQEVETAFPEAVSISNEFIPNVYASSVATKIAGGQMTISLDKKHEFAAGDEVKIILPTGGEKKMIVKSIPSENTFVVDWKGEAAADQVFVFGKKVSDFHQVDYDRIFTLNVSATQELARKVELLEKENAALKSTLSKKDEQIEGMKSSAEKFDARLRALENKLSN